MKSKIAVVCSLLVFALTYSTDAQRREPLDINMDWESYDPPSTLVVPENPKTHAKFPFIDVHSHHWRWADNPDLSELAGEMDELNMKIIVNLSGRNSSVLTNMTENIESQGYSNRMVVFSNIDFRTILEDDWVEQTTKQLEYDVSKGSRGLKIYKSQGMFNEDSEGNRVPLNHPKLAYVWEKCGELGIPVFIHAADPKQFWMPHDSLNERWLELKLRPNRKREADDPAPWEQIISEHNKNIQRNEELLTRIIL